MRNKHGRGLAHEENTVIQLLSTRRKGLVMKGLRNCPVEVQGIVLNSYTGTPVCSLGEQRPDTAL